MDLDGINDDPNGIIQDTCGDIDDAHSPLNPNLTLTVTCIDDDGDGQMELPVGVSWRQPGANELCTSPLNAYPGSPAKCKANPGFSVDIPVPARIIVHKITDPDPDLTDTSFPFAVSGGPDPLDIPFILNNGETWDSGPAGFLLLPGTYQVTESEPANWSLSDLQCTTYTGTPDNRVNEQPYAYTNGADVTLGDGEILDCSYTNLATWIDLSMDMTCPDFQVPASEYDYAIDVTNDGPGDVATPVSFVNQLPSEISWTGNYTSSPGGSCAATGTPGEILCTLDAPSELAEGSTWSATLEVSIDDTGPPVSVTNVATAHAGNERLSAGYSAQCAATTPVTLAYFSSAASGDGVEFDWATVTESGNVGFNLYVSGDSGFSKINDEIILSSAIYSLAPVNYHYAASGIVGSEFYIEDLDVTGKANLAGPFLLGETFGLQPEADVIEWEQIEAEHRAAENATKEETAALVGLAVKELQADATDKNDSSWEIEEASGTVRAARLGVNEDGVYRVTYEDLLHQGINLEGVNPKHIAVKEGSKKIPRRVVTGGKRFGPGDYVEFVGYGVNTLYTKERVYTLLVDKRSVRNLGAYNRSSPVPGGRQRTIIWRRSQRRRMRNISSDRNRRIPGLKSIC